MLTWAEGSCRRANAIGHFVDGGAGTPAGAPHAGRVECATRALRISTCYVRSYSSLTPSGGYANTRLSATMLRASCDPDQNRTSLGATPTSVSPAAHHPAAWP